MAQLTPERIAEVESEHGQQTALFAWAALPETRLQCPGIEYMFAIPNGGERNLKVAGNLKAEGVRKGVLDIFLPVPLERETACSDYWYHGLWIEMKWGKNTISIDQIAFGMAMEKQGYCVRVCWSFYEAKQTILDYYARTL